MLLREFDGIFSKASSTVAGTSYELSKRRLAPDLDLSQRNTVELWKYFHRCNYSPIIIIIMIRYSVFLGDLH